MKLTKKFLIILSVISAAMILSACAGGPIGATNWPGIAADENTIYLAYSTHIYALNPESGSEKWRYPADKPDPKKTFYAAPVTSPDGQLLAGSYNHSLYSLNMQTGSENWSFAEAKDLFVASPLVTSKGIYAPNADGKLYALDLQGRKFAEFQTENHLWATPATDPECECIYLPSMDHHLYALSTDTLKPLWKSEDFGGSLVAQPVLGPDNTIYIGTFGSEMLAIDHNNGQVKWRFPTKGWVFTSPALEGDTLFFGDMKGNFYAIKVANGEQIWSKEIGGAVVSPPLVKDGVIYITTESENLYAFNLDGTPQWTQTMKFLVYGPIVAAGDLLLVGPNNPAAPLIALTASGTERWTFSLQK